MTFKTTMTQIPESSENLLSNASLTARKKKIYGSRTSIQDLMKETEEKVPDMNYTKVLSGLPKFINSLTPFERCVFIERFNHSRDIWDIAKAELMHHDQQRIEIMCNEVIKVIRTITVKFQDFCKTV